jgi:hypothetical protein
MLRQKAAARFFHENNTIQRQYPRQQLFYEVQMNSNYKDVYSTIIKAKPQHMIKTGLCRTV